MKQIDNNLEDNIKKIRIVITTNDQFIDGDLFLPENIQFRSSSPDNLLFYFLNGGFQFITLQNCEVRERKNIAFRPDTIDVLHVRVAAIITVQVVESFVSEAERLQRYTSRNVAQNLFDDEDMVLNTINIGRSRTEKQKRKKRKTNKD